MRELIIPGNDIRYGQKLKESRFSEVHKARWQNTDVAVKIFLIHLAQNIINDFKNEIQIHSSFDHPNIVPVIGMTEAANNQYGMVMEHMPGGSLHNILAVNERETFGWDKRRKIAIDIANGLSFLHERNIIHGNLKSTNVFLDENCQAKLAGFGLSAVRKRGSHAWLAPEIMDNRTKCNTKSDIFSYGVILWELISHMRPFMGCNNIQIATKVLGNKRNDFLQEWNTPEAYRKLTQLCWAQETANRPTIDQIISSLESMIFLPHEPAQLSSPTQMLKSENNDFQSDNDSVYLANSLSYSDEELDSRYMCNNSLSLEEDKNASSTEELMPISISGRRSDTVKISDQENDIHLFLESNSISSDESGSVEELGRTNNVNSDASGKTSDRYNLKKSWTVLFSNEELPPRPKKYKALDNYVARDENQLSFRKGDILNILDKKGKWLIAELNGKMGGVPSNYLKPYRRQLQKVPHQTNLHSFFQAAAEQKITNFKNTIGAEHTIKQKK